MGGINVARTCDLLSAKLEVTYQRNGFLVRLRGGSGIVCTKFERKDQQTIKSNQIKAQFGLELITCTPPDKINVVYHTGQPLHYSRIRSFKIPTIPLPITTSRHSKTSLNIIFTQFCILLSHQNAHQNKIYSLKTTTDFCVASAKLRPLPCGTNIFAGV